MNRWRIDNADRVSLKHNGDDVFVVRKFDTNKEESEHFDEYFHGGSVDGYHEKVEDNGEIANVAEVIEVSDDTAEGSELED